MAKKTKTRSKKNVKPAVSKPNDSSDENIVSLRSKLSISNVSQLVDDLKAGLDAKGPIQIDLSKFEQADTAAFQVLVGFVNTAVNSKREIQWQGETEELKKLSKILAVDSYLEFDSNQPSDDLCPVF